MGIPLIGALGSIAGGIIKGIGSVAAGNAVQAGIKKAGKAVTAGAEEAQGYLEPVIGAGDTARSYQLGALGLPGGVDRATAEAAFRDAPGYQFAFNQGQNAVQTSAAAGGRLFSGGTLKALTKFGQGIADQSFGQWFDRVGGFTAAGTNARGAGAGIAMDRGRTLADLARGGGEARASSYAGVADAGIGTLQNLGNLSAYYNPPSWLKSAGSLPIAGAQQGNFAANPFGRY